MIHNAASARQAVEAIRLLHSSLRLLWEEVCDLDEKPEVKRSIYRYYAMGTEMELERIRRELREYYNKPRHAGASCVEEQRT